MTPLLRLIEALNRDDRQALGLNLVIPVFLGLLANGLALWMGRDNATNVVPWFAPPGWVAAIVWSCLFALLGLARWSLNSYTIIGVSMARTMVTLLILACLLWPAYSLPAVDLSIRMSANTVNLLFAALAVFVVRQRSSEAAALIMPTVVWLAFTTLVAVTALSQV